MPTACRSAPSPRMTSEPAPEATDGPATRATDEPSSGHGHAGRADQAQAAARGREADDAVGCPRRTRPRRPTAPAPTTTGASCSTRTWPRTSYLTGTFVQPGNAEVVHHVILFTVPPGQVADAEAMDAAAPRRGLDLLRRLGAARRRRPQQRAVAGRLGAGRQGVGERAGLRQAARGRQPDHHAGPLQPAGRPGTRRVRTLLRLRARLRRHHAARDDAAARAGRDAVPREVRRRAAVRPRGLDRRPDRRASAGPATPTTRCTCCAAASPRPATPPRCDRAIGEPTTIRGVAGHMHLLGRSIKIEVNPGTPRGEDDPGHPDLGLRQPGQQADQAGARSTSATWSG